MAASDNTRVQKVPAGRSSTARTAKPKYARQRGYDNQWEQVDVNEYNIQISCPVSGCKNVRYVKPQDAFQVKFCKPHTVDAQRQRRAEQRRERRARIREEVERRMAEFRARMHADDGGRFTTR